MLKAEYELILCHLPDGNRGNGGHSRENASVDCKLDILKNGSTLRKDGSPCPSPARRRRDSFNPCVQFYSFQDHLEVVEVTLDSLLHKGGYPECLVFLAAHLSH